MWSSTQPCRAQGEHVTFTNPPVYSARLYVAVGREINLGHTLAGLSQRLCSPLDCYMWGRQEFSQRMSFRVQWVSPAESHMAQSRKDYKLLPWIGISHVFVNLFIILSLKFLRFFEKVLSDHMVHLFVIGDHNLHNYGHFWNQRHASMVEKNKDHCQRFAL